jgi:hypothetical protein
MHCSERDGERMASSEQVIMDLSISLSLAKSSLVSPARHASLRFVPRRRTYAARLPKSEGAGPCMAWGRRDAVFLL